MKACYVYERRLERARREREHQLDRMVSAACWRREQARKGLGCRFEIPRRARL